MNRQLRGHLLHRPDIGDVHWPEPLVRGAFTPTIKTPFMVSHEVLAVHHRMLLDPDDGLTEIELRLLQRRWVRAAVAVPSPDIWPAPLLQLPRNVPEPCTEHLGEVVVTHLVVRDRPVLCSKLSLTLRRACFGGRE